MATASRRDPFVRALEKIMYERELDKKELAAICSVNDQTVRKLFRTGSGSIKLRQKIAAGLGFKSFAELYAPESASGPDKEKQAKEVMDVERIIKRLDEIERRFSEDVRNIRTQIDLIAQQIIAHPFVERGSRRRA